MTSITSPQHHLDPARDPDHARRHRYFTGLGRRLQIVWREIAEDEVLDRAAALSFYLVFALFPMLLFLTALLGMLRLDLMQLLMAALDAVVPTDVVDRVVTEVTQNTSSGLLSFGIVATLWSAATGMSALMTAINAAFDLPDRRPWWKRQAIAIALTLGVTAVLPFACLLLLFGDHVGELMADMLYVGPWIATLWSIVRWVLIVALLDLGISLVYYLSLAKRPHWRWITPGSTFAMASWLAMSMALRSILRGVMALGTTYGSIASVIALLLWLYYTGALILLGAEIDSEIGRDWQAVKEAVE
ncbi:MAG: YihY/virulence factor BrkB family protein [Gemmatimonadetes bacterium]|nr:YihY/virulence factor BrkB family protein [Gemmatimonadota bacterium]